MAMSIPQAIQSKDLNLICQHQSSFYHEMVDSYYRHKPAYGLYDKVIDMEKWFAAERKSISALLNYNTPLVLVGHEGSGRTTLIYQWIEFHEAKSEFFVNVFDKNTYLLHFVCSSNIKNSHYQMISRVINKMRTVFDLNQRIEMQNDKLRTFFFRWLELADKKKRMTTTEKCKIILVIDGIDRFEIEEQSSQQIGNHNQINQVNYHMEEEPPDWFPQCFPLSFRVIITCKKNSKAYQHFRNMKIPFQFLEMPDIQEESMRSIIEAHFNMSSSIQGIDEIPILKEQVLSYINSNKAKFNNHLFLHTFLHVLHPLNIDLRIHKLTAPTLDELSEFNSVEELFKFSLKFYEQNKILPRSKFRRISCILAVSKTGLKREELKDCLEVKVETVDVFLKIFNFSLLEHRAQFRINNEQFKRTIEKFYMQEELFKNEIHSSIVTILSKIKHFNSNSRLIDEVTYNIYKQSNQWLRLKDLLSNLEIFSQMYKPQDKYTLAQFWQKLEQHGFDPVYEYNKTVEAFVLNYFPTPSELFVILTQLGRFFKELGDLESKCTPEFKHPPLIISPELEQIKLQKELESIGGMLTESKQTTTPTGEDERFNVDNPLFMQAYRERQVALLKKENPLFPTLQLYYYKRWIWLQFPWFCMDINSSFSTYMSKAIGKSIHLHMNYAQEMDLVTGSLKIIKEAKSRKQLSGKNQIYAVPIEFTLEEEDLQREREETKYSSSDDSFTSKLNQQINSKGQSFRHTARSAIGSPNNFAQTSKFATQTPRVGEIGGFTDLGQAQSGDTMRQTQVMTARNNRSSTGNRFLSKNNSQAILFQSQRNSLVLQNEEGFQRPSQYSLSKAKWINQDYELANLKSKIKPENAVRIVSNQVQNYERKELQTAVQNNREMINELNKLSFEIQQKERIFQSLQNCILQLDNNNKENQAFEKKLSYISEKLDQTKTQYRIARKEQNRLRHIVNFCFKNKADNHEWIQGLELGVQNMVTLIKFEKESIIESRNLVIELKKESKEMLKLKNERKMLQSLTTQTMYGMINEKQNIRSLRDEFCKRKDSIIMGHAASDQDISLIHRSEIVEQRRSKEKSSSPSKSVFGEYRQGHNSKSKARSGQDQYYSLQSDQSNVYSESQMALISKVDQIRICSGAKSIENYQTIIDFWQNYQRVLSERDSKELAIVKLKEEKALLQQKLSIFHKMDIEKSNAKYQPHLLLNNIQEMITDAQMERNQAQIQQKKAQDQLINVQVLLEELKKKAKLPLPKAGLNQPESDILIENLQDISKLVEERYSAVQRIVGDMKFHEAMLYIASANPREVRKKLNAASKMKSRHQISDLQRNHTEDPLLIRKDESENVLNFQGDQVPKIILNHHTDRSSDINNNQEASHFESNYDGIFIEDMEMQFNLKPIQSNQSQIAVENLLGDSQIAKPRNSLVGKNQLKKPIKRNSKAGSEIAKCLPQELSKNQSSKIINIEPQFMNIYQIPRPIYLDESTYTYSILNMSRTQKEKESLFYQRAVEQEKDADVISQTLNNIHQFKRNYELQSSLDDSFRQLEEERKNIRSRETNSAALQSHNNSAQKKRNILKIKPQEIIFKGKNQKQSNIQRVTENQAFSSHRDERAHFDQDEPPANQHDEKILESSQNPLFQKSHISGSQQEHFLMRGNRGSQSQRNLKFNSKQALDDFLNDEANKLPSYAKQILSSNHKDIISKIKELNQNVKKLNTNDLFKKLMAQTDKHKRQKSTDKY